MLGQLLKRQRWLAADGVRALCCLALAASCTKFASELDEVEGKDGRALSVSPPQPRGRDWTCVDRAAVSAAGVGARESLTYSFSLVDFVTRAPLSDVRVRACFRPDVSCETPATDYLVPDAEGRVNVEAYSGFNGYLEITSAGMLPVLTFFAAPWSAELLQQLQRAPVQLLPLPSLQALGASARVPLDPSAGVVGIYTYDCLGASAPGVRLAIDNESLPYAFVDDLPVANRDVTSEQGLAGFVNVPPGVVVVSGFPEGQLEPVTVDSLLVRGGWLSSLSLLPTFSR